MRLFIINFIAISIAFFVANNFTFLIELYNAGFSLSFIVDRNSILFDVILAIFTGAVIAMVLILIDTIRYQRYLYLKNNIKLGRFDEDQIVLFLKSFESTFFYFFEDLRGFLKFASEQSGTKSRKNLVVHDRRLKNPFTARRCYPESIDFGWLNQALTHCHSVWYRYSGQVR